MEKRRLLSTREQMRLQLTSGWCVFKQVFYTRWKPRLPAGHICIYVYVYIYIKIYIIIYIRTHVYIYIILANLYSKLMATVSKAVSWPHHADTASVYSLRYNTLVQLPDVNIAVTLNRPIESGLIIFTVDQ